MGPNCTDCVKQRREKGKMEMNYYQKKAKSTCKDTAYNYQYLIMNLCAEAGEVAGKYAKYVRDGGFIDKFALAAEVGDVLWQVAVLADWLGFDLSEVADMNLEKLASRAERGKIGGSGDSR